MKMKLIALAAMLVASGAQAKIADSNDITTGTGGDLYASVVSASNTTNYTVDLGLSIDEFVAAPVNAAGVKLVWDFDDNTFSDLSAVSTGLESVLQTLNYGDVWTNFATASVLGAADLKFDVKAMDGLPSTIFSGSLQNNYLSTSLNQSVSVNNSSIFGADTPQDVYVNAANNDTTNSTHGTDFNTAGANSYAAATDNSMAYFESYGDQWSASFNFSAVASVDDALNFYLLQNSSGSGAALATVTKFEGVWTFDETTAQLTYMTTPVPEAETYAMMLAGLGLVGFMAARRRRA